MVCKFPIWMLADLMLMIGTEDRDRMQSSAMVSAHMRFLALAFLPFWRKEKVMRRDCLPRTTPERKGKLQLCWGKGSGFSGGLFT